ncbi:hypothetical protein PFZ55_39825 [Streptomyces sp. MS2A]|nr:hypothetical protein [Streptomyces sp. MS2A]
MNDYGAAIPLWTFGGLADPTDYPLSDDLVADLEAWSRTFQRHFEPVTGWDDPEVAAGHLAEGQRLFVRLREELGSDYQVEASFWEHEGN